VIKLVTPDAQLDQRIQRCKVQMLLNHPFYSLILIRMKMIAVDCEEIPQIGTDGTNIWYNVNFMSKLNEDEMTFVLGHQVLHVVYDHFERRQGREHKEWEFATDFSINLDLVQSKIGELPRKEIIKLCFDEKYRDKTSYQIYEDLLKNPNQMKGNQLLDTHMDYDSKNGQGLQGLGLTPADMSQRGADDMVDSVIQAAKTAGLDSLPARLRSILNEFLEPKISWRDYLQTSIRSLAVDDYSLMRPNRKSWGLGVVLPGTEGFDCVNLAVSIDVSGSVSESMIRDMLSEIKGITESFNDYKLHVWMFDTRIHNPQIFTPENISDLDTYEIMGGGGTTLDINWHYMIENDIEVDKFILFTDAYCGDDRYRSRGEMYETIFVIFDNPSYKEPFGEMVHYDPSM
jgi:predicted metal-dependent peptidase